MLSLLYLVLFCSWEYQFSDFLNLRLCLYSGTLRYLWDFKQTTSICVCFPGLCCVNWGCFWFLPEIFAWPIRSRISYFYLLFSPTNLHKWDIGKAFHSLTEELLLDKGVYGELVTTHRYKAIFTFHSFVVNKLLGAE